MARAGRESSRAACRCARRARRSCPPGSPLKTRSPAVASTEASSHVVAGTLHCAFAGDRVERREIALLLRRRRRLHDPVAAGVPTAFLRNFVANDQVAADLEHRDVHPARPRRPRGLVPTLAADRSRAQQFGFPGFRFVAAYQLALRRDRGDPVVVLHEGPGGEELAGRAIEHPGEAALGHVHQRLARAAADGQVHQLHFVGGVVIPHVLRNLLVVPLSLPVSGSSAITLSV